MLRALQKYSVPSAVHLEHPTSFEDIASETNLDEEFISRIIKLAAANHIFSVDEASGLVSHTTLSRAMMQHEAVRDSLRICLDERFLATAGLVDYAMTKFGHIDEPLETAFQLAFDTQQDYLTFIRAEENEPELDSMHGFLGFVMNGSKMGARLHDMDLLASNVVDWEALGEGLVIDVSHILYLCSSS